MLIEMFDPFETEFICSPVILVYPNDLVGWRKVVAISIFEMVLIYYNNKWRYRLTIRIDVLDYSDLFLIARLYGFSFFTPIIRCYNKGGCDLAYEKVCFVEVLNVGLYDIMLGNYILEKSKSSFNDLWVFVLGLLVIVRTIPMCMEF